MNIWFSSPCWKLCKVSIFTVTSLRRMRVLTRFLFEDFDLPAFKKQNIQLTIVSMEMIRMAKSRPRKNQSERSDYLKTTLPYNKYMLLAGWEVRIRKNCDRGLENARGPTVSRSITFYLFSFGKLAYKWVCFLEERCIKAQIYFELLYVGCI